MILLSGHSLAAARKVPLESMQLTLEERNSTASIVPADMTGIGVNSWLQDETNPGKGIVWRVRSIRQAFNSDTTTVSLEHAISVLKDTILFGDITTAKIAGKSSATEVTAKKALQYILGKTADWTLGAFDYTDSNPYKFDGETLYDAIEAVSDSLEDPVWTYDFSSYPFKLNITKRNTAVDSELRANRNLRTITKTIDRSGMYTRFYPIGKDDLHIDGDYVERNTAAYGVISRVETDASLDTKKELKRWGNQRLKKHAEPVVTIDVEGLELADATGEPLDQLTVGRVCRIPLPEFGTEIQEKITRLSYQDKVKQPENVKATLANNRTDVTRIIADAIKKGGSSRRTSTKKGAEDRAWMEDTNDHVALCAKGIIGTDATGKPNWERLSKIVVDGKGIHQTVTDVQNGVKQHESRLDQDEKSIGLVVGSYDSSGRYIKAGEICLAINNDGSSEAKINATKILLEGNVRMNDVLRVTDNRAYFKKPIWASGGILSTDLQLRGGNDDYTVNAQILGTMVKSASVSGNTLTLTRFNGSTINFSKAITLSGRWDGRKFTATPSAGTPLVTELRSSVPNSKRTISGNTVTMTIQATIGDSETFVDCGEVTVNVPQTSYESKTLRCTSVEPTYPGSTTNYYYFRLEGRYSFSSGSNYTMYRTSW